MRWNKYKIVCIVFIVFIMLTGLSTAVFGAKQIGYNMLVGYKKNLNENATGLDKVRAIIAGCEDGMNTEYVLEDQCINLYGGFQKLLGKRVVNDVDVSKDVIKLNNGYLSFYGHQKLDVSEIVKNTVEFDEFLKEKDIPLLYVQAPFKISKYDNKLPEGIKDYNNEKADDYLKELSKVGIDTLDLREAIKQDGIGHYSMFFKTDHHWTPKAGLWAFGKISEKLNANYGFNIDKKLWNQKNYNIKTYKDWYLGSEGKRTGIYYTGIDDFDIITPKFETNFDFKVESQNIHRKGAFKDAVLDWTRFGKQDYFNELPYSTYSGGDVNLANIKNKKETSGKKILLIKDSFSSVLIPFLALGSSNLDVVDVRQPDKINLREYIENTNPDIVIIMYNPSIMFKESNAFEFK